MGTKGGELKTFAALLMLLACQTFASDDGIRIVSWPSPSVSVAAAIVTAVTVSNSGVVTLLPARQGRLKAILFNDNNTLYIKAGTNASNNDYTWRAPANTEIDVTNYSGPITAILNTAGPGTCHVSDF
jgi:hypothetical protein